MNPFLERIGNGEVLLGDGALGTMLIQKGLKAGECPEIWNIERPELLGEIASLYLDAGSDIISTNTFGGHPLKLEQYILHGRTEEINRAGVRAIKDTVKGKSYLAASCGPCGKLMKPYGDTDAEEISRGFERQLRALIEEGVDVIYFETMIDLAEALLGVKAAKSIAPGIPVCATMTFDYTPRGFFTVMGNSIEQTAKELEEAGADVVGSNCGNGIENMVKIAEEFRKHSKLPVLIQSNAGLPIVEGDILEYPETPEFMAERVRTMLDLRINIIGGCCGTTPRHIASFRKTIDSYGH
jgi:5-methyltetrahydrofolate--homocysteine methyltransferase